MFVAKYTIVDWGPHGVWLSKYADDINSTVCDYATQVAQKVTNTTMEHSMTKDFLGGLMVEWPPFILESFSINRLGLNNGTSGNFLQAPKNLELELDILWGPVIVSNYSFHYNHSYFIQACVRYSYRELAV